MSESLVVALTRQLVNINTVNPPGNEAEAVRLVAPLLADAGFKVKEYDYGPGRMSLVAHWGRNDQPTILLSGHLDTVPLGAKPWKVAPFAGDCVEGKLFGRGAADMKGGVAMLVTAAIEFSRHQPDSPITLVLSADEEIGCGGATRLVAENHIPEARCVLVAEPTDNIPRLGHKGILWLKTLFHGKTSHAAFPQLGDNALVKAAEAVLAVNKNIFAGRTHPIMGEATLVTSRFFSGDNYNSVPDFAEVGIDIRSTVDWSHVEILGKIKKIFGRQETDVEVLFDLPPLWTGPENELVREIFAVCNDMTGEIHSPGIITFYTDGGIFGPELGNIPVIILGPGDPGMAHQVDEYVPVADLGKCLAMYLEILKRLG